MGRSAQSSCNIQFFLSIIQIMDITDRLPEKIIFRNSNIGFRTVLFFTPILFLPFLHRISSSLKS
jgi:hypothetical protein